MTSRSFSKLSRKPIQRLQDAGLEAYGNEKGKLLNEGEMVEAIQGVGAVILRTEVFNRNVTDHADKLKIVSRYSVGLGRADAEYLKGKSIALQIARNTNTSSVADHTIGLMPSLCHNITRSDASTRPHVWKEPIVKNLYQSTVGILGLGAIGKAAARRPKRFDCHILVSDSYYDEAFIWEYGIRKADVNEIVNSSDFLTLHLPALAEFSPLLNAKAFSGIKKGAVIISTTRTKLIDRQALYDALHNGQPYGYDSDVHCVEPGFDEELIAYENIVLTPYIAVSSKGVINRMSGIAVNHMLVYSDCQ